MIWVSGWEAEPWGALLGIAAIVLSAGFVHSAIGLGYGMLALALLPMVIDIRQAHILVSTTGVPVMAFVAWTWRGETDRRTLGVAVLGALLFIPLGLALFAAMSPVVLMRASGAAIIVTVLLTLRRSAVGGKRSSSTAAGFLAGAVSGFLAGAVSIAGPPLAIHAIRQSWSPRKFKAFVAQCLLVISVLRLTGLALTGFIARDVLLRDLAMIPLAFAGIYLGMTATRRMDAQHFRVIVAVALILIGISMILQSSL